MKYNLLFGLLFVLLTATMCKSDSTREASSSDIVSGELLSKRYCVSCHLYPEPDQLDKNTWHEFVLPRMAAFMGIYTDGRRYYESIPKQWIEPGSGGARVKAAKVYPDSALLSKDEWIKIFDYYVEEAPLHLPEVENKLEVNVGLPNFKSRPFLKNAVISPLIQSVSFDSTSTRLFFAEMDGGVFMYDHKGKLVNTYKGRRFIVDMEVVGNKLHALDMGSRIATDNPQGAYLEFNFEGKDLTEDIVQSQLMRPVDVKVGQLDDDEGLELVFCEYGNLLGQLAIYDPAADSFNVVVLVEDDGYVSVELSDMNQDGRLDIVALQGNGNEGVDIFWNEGNLNFRRDRVLRFQPTSGSTHMNLVDFNQDGKMDILYCSGDNGDYTPINKPYHGIYVYQSEGTSFKERLFLPMNGVYQAEAVDFDEDGDLDIAAVSFHPDFIRSPKSSFIYFENSDNKFSAFTVKEFNHSRWMRFVVGDFDADNDKDILLTAMNIKTPEIPVLIADNWREKDLPVLLIENQKVK